MVNPARFISEGTSAKYRGLNVEGIKEITAIFKALPQTVQNKIQRETMRKSLAPMESDIRNLTPVGPTGNLKNSIISKVSIRRAKGIVYGFVAWDSNEKGGRKAQHASLIERGWMLTGPKPNKKKIRRIPGQRIFRRTLEKHANFVVEQFVAGLRDATLKAEGEINRP